MSLSDFTNIAGSSSLLSGPASSVLGSFPLSQTASTVASLTKTASSLTGFGGNLGVNNLLNGTVTSQGIPFFSSAQQGFQRGAAIADPLQAGIDDAVSHIAYAPDSDAGLSDEIQNSMGVDSVAKDDQRLHIVRSRAARALYDNHGPNGTYTSDRGPITRIKLLKGPDADPATKVKDARSNVDSEVQDLLRGTFASFFLTGLTTNLSEKTQVLTTFGDNEVVYYFGKQPITMTLTGILFDSLENDWFSKFLTLYAGILRGTELAKDFSLVQITFPNMIATGTISGISTNQTADRDTDIGFSMQFIVKELVPMPVKTVSGNLAANEAKLIDFAADRSGVAGYTLSSGTLAGGFMNTVNSTVSDVNSAIGGITSGLSGITGALSGAAGSVSSTLNSFRTNIFSPVYGIISSITKVVKSATGTITGIISSFTNPVNAVLRDITNIASQATGVALMVEHSINSILAIPARTVTNLRNTLTALKNTAGTISRVPEDVSQTFKRLYGGGYVNKGSAILSSGKTRTKSKVAVLSSGRRYSHVTSNRL